MSRLLNDLSSRFYPLACQLIARCAEAGIPVMIICTGRTPTEQEENIKKGVSWTKNSKHLPDVMGKSNAIDICPYHVFDLHGPDKLQWDSNDPAFEAIGKVGEGLGLTWGGRWKVRDSGHFELQ